MWNYAELSMAAKAMGGPEAYVKKMSRNQGLESAGLVGLIATCVVVSGYYIYLGVEKVKETIKKKKMAEDEDE